MKRETKVVVDVGRVLIVFTIVTGLTCAAVMAFGSRPDWLVLIPGILAALATQFVVTLIDEDDCWPWVLIIAFLLTGVACLVAPATNATRIGWLLILGLAIGLVQDAVHRQSRE